MQLTYSMNQIYYVEFCRTWVTISSEFKFYNWDLLEETAVSYPREKAKKHGKGEAKNDQDKINYHTNSITCFRELS